MSVTENPTQPRNGVDVETLFATLGAVRDQPELARFQFRSSHEWVSGTQNRGAISGFYGAGQEHEHKAPTVITADHPVVLVGQDKGPTPAELLLNALGACLMSGLGLRTGRASVALSFRPSDDPVTGKRAADTDTMRLVCEPSTPE